jgi:tRNA-dihydrouridine synthase
VTGPESSRLKPLKIGEIAVANRVLLAPMSGVTDAPFRRLAATLGAGLVVSEMTASDELVHGRPMSLLRCETAGVGAHVVQLAGCEAHWMAEGARVAEAAGADIIDINMGCPARHVTGGQSGSALMRDLDHALKLIEATIAAVKVPVTLKMRLGWDDRSLARHRQPACDVDKNGHRWILFHPWRDLVRRAGAQRPQPNIGVLQNWYSRQLNPNPWLERFMAAPAPM